MQLHREPAAPCSVPMLAAPNAYCSLGEACLQRAGGLTHMRWQAPNAHFLGAQVEVPCIASCQGGLH